MKKDIRKLLREAEKQGFTVTRRKSGHWKITDSVGHFVLSMSGTPSDPRALKNARAALRRAGFAERS